VGAAVRGGGGGEESGVDGLIIYPPTGP
jgi:hypothetical protein